MATFHGGNGRSRTPFPTSISLVAMQTFGILQLHWTTAPVSQLLLDVLSNVPLKCKGFCHTTNSKALGKVEDYRLVVPHAVLCGDFGLTHKENAHLDTSGQVAEMVELDPSPHPQHWNTRTTFQVLQKSSQGSTEPPSCSHRPSYGTEMVLYSLENPPWPSYQMVRRRNWHKDIG